MAFDVLALKREFSQKKLERLAHLEVPEQLSLLSGNSCSPALAMLKQWSQDNKESMKKSMAQQVFGAKRPIDWNLAFLPFLESMAVNLRDWGRHHHAWSTYRQYKQLGANDQSLFEEAISFSIAANEDIEKLADQWDMDYIEICDLPYENPSGHIDWDGAYCGAFVTRAAQKDKPFIGLAFKGTNPFNIWEDNVDINYQLTASSYLDEKEVSAGVYTGLFGAFLTPDNPPYAHILEQLDTIAENMPRTRGKAVRMHVTGHSFRGSYSQLCYAQLLIDIGSPKPTTNPFDLGDEYTFGAPRVGSPEWAQMNFDLVRSHEGSSWRIVNDQDVVPQIPPTTLKRDQVNFCHVDNGMRIFGDKPPAPIPTERHGPLPQVYAIDSIEAFIKFVVQRTYHVPTGYYDAMRFAIQNQSEWEPEQA